MFNHKKTSGILILIVIIVAGFLVFHWGPNFYDVNSKKSYPEGPIIPTKNLSDFHLTDHQGQPYGLEQLKGSWSAIFFGYTMCPDVCPMSLGLMSESFSLMEKEPQGFHGFKGIFVSVDPKRDTFEKLKEYIGYFHSSFIGITGTKGEIDNFARQIGAAYIIQPPKDPNDPETYGVTHSSSIYFVNPKGQLVDMILEPKTAEEIAMKARTLQKQNNS